MRSTDLNKGMLNHRPKKNKTEFAGIASGMYYIFPNALPLGCTGVGGYACLFPRCAQVLTMLILAYVSPGLSTHRDRPVRTEKRWHCSVRPGQRCNQNGLENRIGEETRDLERMGSV